MNYPRTPDPRLTPGSLCTTPTSHRHPEQIAYCERDVNFATKELIFQAYRRDLGYSLSGDRYEYKIDHFIPLCLGGSNNVDNLWPQYKTISEVTDPLEALACDKLSKGKINHRTSLDLIVRAKLNLKEAPAIFKYLQSIR